MATKWDRLIPPPPLLHVPIYKLANNRGWEYDILTNYYHNFYWGGIIYFIIHVEAEKLVTKYWLSDMIIQQYLLILLILSLFMR